MKTGGLVYSHMKRPPCLSPMFTPQTEESTVPPASSLKHRGGDDHDHDSSSVLFDDGTSTFSE